MFGFPYNEQTESHLIQECRHISYFCGDFYDSNGVKVDLKPCRLIISSHLMQQRVNDTTFQLKQNLFQPMCI